MRISTDHEKRGELSGNMEMQGIGSSSAGLLEDATEAGAALQGASSDFQGTNSNSEQPKILPGSGAGGLLCSAGARSPSVLTIPLPNSCASCAVQKLGKKFSKEFWSGLSACPKHSSLGCPQQQTPAPFMTLFGTSSQHPAPEGTQTAPRGLNSTWSPLTDVMDLKSNSEE